MFKVFRPPLRAKRSAAVEVEKSSGSICENGIKRPGFLPNDSFRKLKVEFANISS